MITQEIANRLVELCRQAEWEQAQIELFAPDAVSIEPHASPNFSQETKGLSAILEKGQKFETMVDKLHRVEISDPLIAEDAIAYKLTMDITMKGQPRATWQEICVYKVKDGKIISEQFFI
jgi:hypothetical protein